MLQACLCTQVFCLLHPHGMKLRRHSHLCSGDCIKRAVVCGKAHILLPPVTTPIVQMGFGDVVDGIPSSMAHCIQRSLFIIAGTPQGEAEFATLDGSVANGACDHASKGHVADAAADPQETVDAVCRDSLILKNADGCRIRITYMMEAVKLQSVFDVSSVYQVMGSSMFKSAPG